jgi:tRNA (guanine-N7-)-methyltransferase
MRLRNKPGAKEKVESHPHIVIPDPEHYKGRWRELFNRQQPLYVEIGTGRGQFLSEMAYQHPDINFIGIELQTSVICTALEKVMEKEVSNVRLLNKHAEQLLAYFAAAELDRIYVNFSDPWPKNKHVKRRLTDRHYLNKYHIILKKQGEIHLKTDNVGLFEFSLNSFADFGCRLRHITFDLHRSSFAEQNVQTEYEQRFSEKGNPIYRCEAFLPELPREE